MVDSPCDIVSADGVDDIPGSNHWVRQKDEKWEVVTQHHFIGRRGGINALIPALSAKYRPSVPWWLSRTSLGIDGEPHPEAARKSKPLRGDRVRPSIHRGADEDEGAV